MLGTYSRRAPYGVISGGHKLWRRGRRGRSRHRGQESLQREDAVARSARLSQMIGRPICGSESSERVAEAVSAANPSRAALHTASTTAECASGVRCGRLET
jgi:hypothetical protein